MTDEDRDKFRKVYLNTDVNKIIITKGTDTVIETARNFADIKNKAIILIGAVRPERFSNSDAGFKVGVADGAINMVEEGIFIAMNGMVCSYNIVKRD